MIDRAKESACEPTHGKQVRMTEKYIFSLIATFDMQVGSSPYGISVRQIPKLASGHHHVLLASFPRGNRHR